MKGFLELLEVKLYPKILEVLVFGIKLPDISGVAQQIGGLK